MSLTVGAIVVQALAISIPSGGTPDRQAQVGPTLNSVETAIIQKTNAERARYGRTPLAVDPGLLKSARQHAQWMTRNRSLRHTSAQVAENIALGQRSTAQVVRDWMNSPGHRANILHPGYSRIGVAAYRGKDGQIYWCQQFLR